MSQTYELIHVFTEDDLALHGLFQPGEKTKTACILIHGFTGDFYSHIFYETIAVALKKQGNALVLAQTRGTGIQTEFVKKNGDGIFIGSFYEKLEEAHYDISAFVKFLQSQGYKKICLIGHSLGTIKAVRYLFEGKFRDSITELVLLAPFDKNAFIERKAPGKLAEFTRHAQEMIAHGEGKKLVPVPEYEDYPTTFETFLSWYNQSDLSRMFDFYKKDYDFPILKKISVPVKVILGEHDEFVDYPELGVSSESALATLKENIAHAQTVLLKNTDHTYTHAEGKVAEEVASFLK